MDEKAISRLFEQTAYTRTGGSSEECKCAEFLMGQCKKFDQSPVMEAFSVDLATIQKASLAVDGREIPCTGYFCAGSAQISAPFYYLTDNSPSSLAQCRGKIVMIDGYLGYWKYQDLLESGALGFITYNGNANFPDRDIDQRELRSFVSNGNKLPGVNIHVKDAIELIRSDAWEARITLQQLECQGNSHNVVLDLPGTIPQYILLSAHYDSTPLSQGAYDNMSGSIGLLSIAEYFSSKPHRYGLRFVWCGSEERGLLGSKAYCNAHKQELQDVALCVNLDMIGCIMGKFEACCTSEEKLVHYLQYFSAETGFGCSATQGVYPSDSTPFADSGVPAITFARSAPGSTATIHDRYDTMAVIKPRQMVEDIRFIRSFVARMANAAYCPVGRTIPDNMKEKLDEYMNRKRPANN